MNLLHKLWPLLFPCWLMHFSCHMPIVEGLFFPWCVHVILINIKATCKYSFGKDRTQSASKCLWQGYPDCQVLQATIQNFHLTESLCLPQPPCEFCCPNSDIPPDPAGTPPLHSLESPWLCEPLTISLRLSPLQTAWAITPGRCQPTPSAVDPCWCLLGPAMAVAAGSRQQQHLWN